MHKLLATAAVLLALAAARFAAGPVSAPAVAASAQAPPTEACEAGGRVMLRLGLDDTAPSDWSGAATGWVAGGGAAWEAESEPSPVKLAGGGSRPRILPATVQFDLPASDCAAGPGADRTVAVETAHGSFEFAPQQLVMGEARAALEGRAEIALIPSAEPVATKGLEEDFPDCENLPDGTVLCAFVEYSNGSPIDEPAALGGDFRSIEFQGNGDRVVLLRRSSSGWGYPLHVTPPSRDVWRPVVTALPGGAAAAVLWSEQRSGNWDIYLREMRLATGVLGPERRLTSDPGQDFNVVASGGYYAWQARRGGGFDILAARIGEAPLRVSPSDANDWRPSIAADGSGAAWVAWDTYHAGNYDVYLRKIDGQRLGEAVAVAASARFEARASVAVDGRGRAWVAFEDSDELWGKDAGDRWEGRQAAPMYLNKNILVRVWDGSLRETAHPLRSPTVDHYHDDTRIATSQRHKVSIPSMALDSGGRPWLLFRKHPLQTGRGEVWRSFAAYYEANRWSHPVPLLGSDHLLDRQPGLAALPSGGLLALTASDGRQRTADRQDSDLFESVLAAPGAPAAPTLVRASALRPERSAPPVHPDEAADVSRLRSRRVRAGGRTLRFLRGEFHRHSAFSSHRDWDGPFEEVWRYGLDVAALDWIGPGDHDYAVSHGYLWWLQQKASDLYHDAGRFSAMYSYERNVSYPSGHRNVILPRRGIRPVPRMRGRERMNGTAEDGSPDIRNLYAYLEHFGGICSSHTSATNMGTDWRDGSIAVEPVVEIFQGHRQSYEVSGGPMAASGPQDSIQGYRPAGFVWEAFRQGRRLGFQASSDHVSTHISYAVVLAEENSRQGVIDAFKRRHSYAANDNIELVVRSGEHLMGDEFTSQAAPRLRIAARGTSPIDSVEIIRQVGARAPAAIAALQPRRREVDLDWSDSAAEPDEWNMYYVRLRQRNEAMAWASPLWIHYEP